MVAPVWAERTDRQTDRTKERRRLHSSTVPLYNILQTCHLCQQRLSKISCTWHDDACEVVSYVTQRACNDEIESNNPHILNLGTSTAEPPASRPGRFIHYSKGGTLGEDREESAVKCCSVQSRSLSGILHFRSY
jgi:hypothetical protein